jgi:hypothetical protein
MMWMQVTPASIILKKIALMYLVIHLGNLGRMRGTL